MLSAIVNHVYNSLEWHEEVAKRTSLLHGDQDLQVEAIKKEATQLLIELSKLEEMRLAQALLFANNPTVLLQRHEMDTSRRRFHL